MSLLREALTRLRDNAPRITDAMTVQRDVYVGPTVVTDSPMLPTKDPRVVYGSGTGTMSPYPSDNTAPVPQEATTPVQTTTSPSAPRDGGVWTTSSGPVTSAPRDPGPGIPVVVNDNPITAPKPGLSTNPNTGTVIQPPPGPVLTTSSGGQAPIIVNVTTPPWVPRGPQLPTATQPVVTNVTPPAVTEDQAKQRRRRRWGILALVALAAGSAGYAINNRRR